MNNYIIGVKWANNRIDRELWREVQDNAPSEIMKNFAITECDPRNESDPEIKRLADDPDIKVVFVDRKWNPYRKHRVNGTEFIGGNNGFREIEVRDGRIYSTWYGGNETIPDKYNFEPWRSLILKHRTKTLQPKSYRPITSRGLLGLIDMIQYIESVSDYPIEKFIGVEIGTYQGAAADVFAQKFDYLETVDPWLRKGKLIVDVKEVYEETMAGVPNVTHIQKTGDDALELFADRSLDFIYIDACHDYDSVVSDINNWKPKLKPDGFLCGHDYPGRGNQTQRAVDDTLGKPDMTFLDRSWLVQYKGGVRV